MKLYYIGFIDWYRENPYLMFVSSALVSVRAKTYRVEEWQTTYPTFKLNNETFLNPKKLEVLKEVKKPFQTVYNKSELETVIRHEAGYLGKDKQEILKHIKSDIENKQGVSEIEKYMLEQVKLELAKMNDNAQSLHEVVKQVNRLEEEVKDGKINRDDVIDDYRTL